MKKHTLVITAALLATFTGLALAETGTPSGLGKQSAIEGVGKAPSAPATAAPAEGVKAAGQEAQKAPAAASGQAQEAAPPKEAAPEVAKAGAKAKEEGANKEVKAEKAHKSGKEKHKPEKGAAE